MREKRHLSDEVSRLRAQLATEQQENANLPGMLATPYVSAGLCIVSYFRTCSFALVDRLILACSNLQENHQAREAA